MILNQVFLKKLNINVSDNAMLSKKDFIKIAKILFICYNIYRK